MPLNTILRGRVANWAITAWYVQRDDESLTFSCGAAFLLFGYDQGVMSGLLTGRAFTAQFPEIGQCEMILLYSLLTSSRHVTGRQWFSIAPRNRGRHL